MDILVGYTGFVGSNLNQQHHFDGVYNSKNISKAFGANPDLCVYAGVRAEKYLANKEPDADFQMIETAFENIKRINPKNLILISTIDVFKTPKEVDECTIIDTENLHAYGYNRYIFEQMVKKSVEHLHIIRLPGLFGKNIKKNFIYDLIYQIPSLLNESKFAELSNKEPLISQYYILQDNGFYRCICQTDTEQTLLKKVFERLNFSALNFTDSRGAFQFYNLRYLWEHIQLILKHDIRLAHLAVEPITINEIYKALTGANFINEVATIPPYYDFRTLYAHVFGKSGCYIFNKEQILGEIVKFVKDEQ
jgi:hypothetical protein